MDIEWLQSVTGWDYRVGVWELHRWYNTQKCFSYLYIERFSGKSKIVPLRYQKQRFLPYQKVIKWRNTLQKWRNTLLIGERNPCIWVIFVECLSL